MEKPESQDISSDSRGGSSPEVKPENRPESKQEPRSDSKKSSSENKAGSWFKRTGTRIRTFFVEHRNELRKVQWPNRKETATYTTIVVVVSLFLSLFIWIIDQGLAYILRWLIA